MEDACNGCKQSHARVLAKHVPTGQARSQGECHHTTRIVSLIRASDCKGVNQRIPSLFSCLNSSLLRTELARVWGWLAIRSPKYPNARPLTFTPWPWNPRVLGEERSTHVEIAVLICLFRPLTALVEKALHTAERKSPIREERHHGFLAPQHEKPFG